MRPSATSVCGLKLLVYEALSSYLPASSFINFSTFSLRIVSAKLAFVTAKMPQLSDLQLLVYAALSY